MKIVKANYWTEQIKLRRPYTVTYQTTDKVDMIFVELELQNGQKGFGVGTPAEFVTGENIESSKKALESQFEALVIDQHIASYHKLCLDAQLVYQRNPAVCNAMDNALHDLFGVYQNLPVAKIYGQYHTSLPTSITIGIKSIEESVEEAIEYKSRGFKIIKLKIGQDLDQDIEMTHKIHETVSSKMRIRVDANQGYSLSMLQSYLQSTNELNIELVEQPLPVGKEPDLQILTPGIRSILAADESLQKPYDALRYCQIPKLFGIYNIKLNKCGGIVAAKQIGDMANLADIQLMWGCMDESVVSISAGLHAALSCPNTCYIDLDGSLDLATDPFKGGFILERGIMRINDKPGLGIQFT